MLKHLNYIEITDNATLLEQYRRHMGTYGPRKFYTSNGKLYYKRKSEGVELPRVHLLALDDHRYMDLTRFNTIMEFTIDSTGVMASSGYNFNAIDGKFEWEELNREVNYFLKSD
jgi:hypothetical protein